jgi:hypothetical protein
MSDGIVKAKIRRALLSGPDIITKEATVAEMDATGKMTVLRPGTNQWVCIPGNENIIGQTDMCADPMGMRWMMDVMARKPAHPHWPALDDPLAFRREGRRVADSHARRGNLGDVRRYALCAPACLRFTMGRQ